MPACLTTFFPQIKEIRHEADSDGPGSSDAGLTELAQTDGKEPGRMGAQAQSGPDRRLSRL